MSSTIASSRKPASVTSLSRNQVPAEGPKLASSGASAKSQTASKKERDHDAMTAFYTTKTSPKAAAKDSDAASDISTHSSIGVLAKEPAPWSPPKPINAMTPAHFGEQVAALAKQTKIARNVMPMIVRGGVIASLGMLLFGHLAPLAIIAVMVGAVVGGYAIAKFMQLRQAKQFAAMGENNPLTLLKNNVPEDASAEDKAKLQSIVDFVEKGDIFGNGMQKTFREPYRALTKRLAAATKPPAQPEAEAARDGQESVKSTLSAAQQEKEAYLAGERAKA